MPDSIQITEKVSSLEEPEPKLLDNKEEKRVESLKQSQDACLEKAASNVEVVEPTALYETITAKELGLLSTAFTIATFMIALDGNILATAIPHITSDFNRLNDVGWYGSAYLLTEMSCQPTFGRIYKHFDARLTYLVSIIIFEVGSILCAAAPNSPALIVGRAISGAGAAGLLCGSLTIYGQSVPLRQRPFGMALVTSMYGIAGVLGPTLGGVITDTPQLTWRFCFWINLPAGAVTFAIAFWVFKTKAPVYGDLPLLQKLQRLDLVGGSLLTAALVAMFIALQWGGSLYKWSNPKVFGCLIVFGILGLGFVAWQAYKAEDATIPIRIISQRTVGISCVYVMLLGIAQATHAYYLPFYFQAVRDTNAAVSGVRNLPYGILCSMGVLATGFLITSKGYYVPYMWLGSSIFIIGANLLRTLDINSSTAKWVGYQIITGLGLGLTEQIPFIAVQVVLPDADMPIACALVVFSRCFGAAIGLSIASNIFSGELLPQLRGIDGVSTTAILAAGITDLDSAVPKSLLLEVRNAFNVAVMRVLIMPIAVGAIALILSFGMERKRIEDVPEVGDHGDVELSEVSH